MVFSESNNFLFLRVPKNASTSLGSFFAKNLATGPKDIYTKISDAGVTNKNFPERVRIKHANQHHFIHMTLQELVDDGVIKESDLKGKKVITVIREPLERQLSLYFFKRKNMGVSPEDFRRHMKNGYYEGDGSNFILQSDYGVLNGKDYAEPWLYENLEAHLAEFLGEIGYWGGPPLPRYKASFKPKAENDELIRSFYDEKTKEAVLSYYTKDIEVRERLMK